MTSPIFPKVRRVTFRLVAVAIAPEIGSNHLITSLHEARGYLAPDHMGLRMAMQQQNRRSCPRAGAVDGEIRQLDPLDVKALKERRRDHLQPFQHGVRNCRAGIAKLLTGFDQGMSAP